jgi:hypothetical protein
MMRWKRTCHRFLPVISRLPTSTTSGISRLDEDEFWLSRCSETDEQLEPRRL